MYKVEVNGRTIEELNERVAELNEVLLLGRLAQNKIPSKEKILNKESSDADVKETIIDTSSPFDNVAPGSHGPVNNVASINTDLDSEGFPWDARIHSSNKEKSEKTGEWRRRHGVSPELEKEVEAELLGQPAKKAPPFGSMSTEQYQQVVAKAPAPMPTTEVHASLPAAPDLLSTTQITQTAPTFAQPVLPANTHNAESFRLNLINILNDLAAAGKINHDWLAAQKPMFGGKDIVQWSENKTACDSLFEAFVGWGLINKL